MNTGQSPSVAQPDLNSALQHCISELTPLLPLLDMVIKSREEEFLRLGSTIFAINSQAGNFSSTASSTAQIASHGAIRETIAELQTQTKEAKTIFSSDASSQQSQGMRNVLKLVDSLNQAMPQFNDIVRTLKVLEITTRIESARLGGIGTDFTTLADDVKTLAAKIVQNTEKIREHIWHLSKQLDTAYDQAQERLAHQAKLVRDMFSNLETSIHDLETMRAESTLLLHDLEQGSCQVTERMGQLIASVQFHDITRQQVEHVLEILTQVVSERDTPTDPGLTAWVRDVLRLQAPQVAQARDMFSQAVTDLIANLGAIADNVEILKQQISMVAHAGQTTKTSPLDSIREYISLVITAMRATSQHAAETSQTMSRMAETIAAASAFVSDIEEIGEEIELIALNARVKAAHTGEQGRALGVLAMEIQNLSLAARAQTGKVSTGLSSIAHEADHMATQAKGADITGMATRLQTQFEAVLERLTDLDNELYANASQLADQGEDLVYKIRHTAMDITFHREVAAELSSLETQIQTLERSFDPFATTLNAARQPERLREQLARYTMHSERMVHHAVLGHPDTKTASGEDMGFDDVELFDTVPTPDPDSLGDNVELF